MSPPSGSKLTIYIDCVSPYSWFGFTNTVRYRPLLQAHGVTVNIVPFFLGGARESAGNPFVPTPKWKEAFSKQDSAVTGELLGLKVVPPTVFPILSLYPVRVATYVKTHYPPRLDATFEALVSGYWSKGINISTTEGIITALKDIFTAAELEDILEGAVTPENKKVVVENTRASGAWGAPWIVGERGLGGKGKGEGEKRSWFGNDRWDQVFAFLGVPYKPVEIVPPGQSQSKL